MNVNGKEVLLVADLLAREKGLDIEKVLEALEMGMSTALKKNYPLGSEVVVSIDTKKNSLVAWRLFYIVDKIDDYETQITLENAKKEKSDQDLIEDDIFYQKIDVSLSRQQFNITKQVALQKLKNEIKENILDNLSDRKDGLLVGTVKSIKKETITIEYANMDILLPKSETMFKDFFKPNDRIYFVLDKTIRTATNTILYASRKSNKFLEEVLKKEIPLIGDGKVIVNSISRIPGINSKVAIFCANPKIDAVKEVVGARGANAKKIKSFLGGESVDFILYNNDKTNFLINCLQPVSPLKVSVDEDTLSADIVVKDENFDYVKKPNYMHHIKTLSGWNVNFYSELQWETKEDIKEQNILNMFIDTLDVDEEIATTLYQMQFENLEEVAFTPTTEFLEEIFGFDEETVVELKERAKSALNDEKLKNLAEFYGFGLNKEQINLLHKANVFTVENLADLDIFELEDILPDTKEMFRKAVIQKARE